MLNCAGLMAQQEQLPEERNWKRVRSTTWDVCEWPMSVCECVFELCMCVIFSGGFQGGVTGLKG